jgi:AraC-like DNA-binding protein
MTDTARDEHSQKNGALGTGGNHRSIPPSGVSGTITREAVTREAVTREAVTREAVSERVTTSAAAVAAPVSTVNVSTVNGAAVHGVPAEGSRTLSSAPPASGTFGSTELESGIHQTVNAAPRPLVTSHGVDGPQPLDLVLLSVTETQVAPGWASADEELSHYELTVIVRGTQCTLRDDGEANSGPVEALLLRPGVRRQERNKGEVDLHRLRIGFTWRTAPNELPETVQDTCGRLHEIASWLVAERDAQFPNVSDYRQSLLRALVGEYLRLSVVAASRIEEKTRTYMLRHLGEPITLEDLATNIGMSRYYFCRVYKEVAGHTPMEHLRALRLERAKDLIRSTALPLKAIAPEVGFGSAQHLCRLLHDRFGVGVRELRGAGTLESRGVASDRGRDPDEAS